MIRPSRLEHLASSAASPDIKLEEESKTGSWHFDHLGMVSLFSQCVLKHVIENASMQSIMTTFQQLGDNEADAFRTSLMRLKPWTIFLTCTGVCIPSSFPKTSNTKLEKTNLTTRSPVQLFWNSLSCHIIFMELSRFKFKKISQHCKTSHLVLRLFCQLIVSKVKKDLYICIHTTTEKTLSDEGDHVI